MLRTVRVQEGVLEGLPAADPRITSFKGIPFASPPVGDRRFAAPEPPLAWDGVRQAYAFAPIPLQPVQGNNPDDLYTREWHVDPDIPMDEDCLYLNVWTPAKSEGEKLPVYVWFFGGGWQVGHTAEMEFDGERLARRGIVVVTVAYRVNVFGFLAHPELTATAPGAPTNFGLLDQRMGLEWVRDNITAFGGDPKTVTIGGQSAGAGSVLFQMANPDNRGLFSRAIVQSGMISSPYGPLFPRRSMESAEAVGLDFFRVLGVQTLEEARRLPADYIRQKWDEYGGFEKSVMSWGPVEDGLFITGDPLELLGSGTVPCVPLLSGYTIDEFRFPPPAKSKEELAAFIKEKFPLKADSLLASLGYPDAPFPQVVENATVNVVECALHQFGRQLQGTVPFWAYEFAVDIPGWDNPGRFHSVDLWFTFETLAKCWRPFTGRHYDMARQIANYWAAFIKTGNPNCEDVTGEQQSPWRPYTKADPVLMRFGDSCEAQPATLAPVLQVLLEE